MGSVKVTGTSFTKTYNINSDGTIVNPLTGAEVGKIGTSFVVTNSLESITVNVNCIAGNYIGTQQIKNDSHTEDDSEDYRRRYK